MNAPLRVRPRQGQLVDPVRVFVARAEEASLWFNGELTLHDAVDVLWHDAIRDGLVDRLGPDRVQQLLSDAFAPLRDDLPRHEDVDGPNAESPQTDQLSEDENQVGNPNLESAADDYDGLPSTFARRCREADEKQARKPVDPRTARARQLLDDDVSLDSAWDKIHADRLHGRVAAATLKAAEYLLRLGDLEKWKKWFDHRDVQQRRAILEHLEQYRKRRRGK
jgi:hypothetical protein